jgi:four helix bundle protein
MDADELKARTKHLALRCIRLAESRPKRDSGRIISDQLIRSSTSVGANDGAACRARSRAEFISMESARARQIRNSQSRIRNR